MLAMSDTDIGRFLPVFASANVDVAFLVPTDTGYGKSIMDATSPVRDLLKESGVHDYAVQGQGPENKVMIDSFFVTSHELIRSSASLYRPVTKKGDPRIWFTGLKKYCRPCNLLALMVIDSEIYVMNLSEPDIAESLTGGGFVHDILMEAVHKEMLVADELRLLIKGIHDRGFIPSITPGDPGVGDTLEDALGISRNNNRTPDYRGIELKATRLTRNGAARQATRSTLFTKVPDEGLTYREIVDMYGKVQVPRGMTEPRLQLYETFRASRANAYGLLLEVDAGADRLKMMHQDEGVTRSYVSAWLLGSLRDALRIKHKETFWVKAISETRDGKEWFRYDRILHTKDPNVSLIAPLIETDKITVDLAAHYEKDGKWRDHGMLFKMKPGDLPLLLGTPAEYDLTI